MFCVQSVGGRVNIIAGSMYGNHHVPTKQLIVMYITYVSLLFLHNVYNKQISIRA